MKRAGFLILTFWFLSLTPVIADSSVNVETTGNSSSSVNIRNSENSTNQTSTSSNCNTNVHIQTNGQTKDYNSTNCGSIDVEAKNGESNIKINGQNVGENSQKTQPQTNSMSDKLSDNEKVASKTATTSPKKEINKENKSTQQIHRLFETVKDFFKKLLSFIF